MFYSLFFFYMMFFVGLYVFSSFRKHLLLILLSLEYMVLSLFYYIFIYLNYFYFDSLLIIYLILSVCEGVLGLSILVSMIRSFGNDYVFSSSLLC
uniref:NADH-ubiquinone oxidoreductase chain 4L n=1 Tax=Ergatettix serrifemora TaxID=2740434 RepID=A0A7G7WQZ6_9ORTH|nr:NADH dehydrogenase subunit 4L [Ergatettix serrifemora]